MAGGKLSPRQKMINMMYLVLTALLALNVTKEVINAFVTINESVVLSKQNLERKNSETYASFAQHMSIDAKKYGDANTRALAVKKEADALSAYLESVKVVLIRKTDKIDDKDSVPSLPQMENKEDYDTPTHVMIGDDDHKGKGAKADTIRQKLIAFKKLIVANAPDKSKANYQKQLDILLNTNDPVKPEDGKSTWELMSFYHNPVVATVALLSKFQTDIRSAESQITEELLNSVGADAFQADVLQPAILPNSTVVTNGSDYEAKVFLAATSSTLAPEVFVGAKLDPTTKECVGCEGTPLPLDANGYAQFKQQSQGEGERKWSGVIRIKKDDGSVEAFPFESSYIAQKPNSVVAAEKMNVLYIGIDNPIAVSVPGVPNDKVKFSISGGGGTIKSNPQAGSGHFLVNVTTVGACTLSVRAEIAGKEQQMGTFPYRVKNVPTPVATISDKYRSGPIDRNILKAGVLVPKLDDFPFDLYYVTLEYKMIVLEKGNLFEYETKGAKLTPEMQDRISKSKTGTKIFFENISARMQNAPESVKSRKLSPMSFTIQ